ncbi:tumor necrosis factor alpha-induced protein 3-like [Erpetoichthys calabaricus]|uniref:tumor necrosis factor alpha-induced protein 3-like n=1 Tax=Erpetoichthys calabaricus TaxID=27687 RepID=UPI002233ECEC|nr:tumor necrosis factor alpha-induced protein 3-like [Erpetoichthys calabaricus]
MEVRNLLPTFLENSNLTKALKLRERIADDVSKLPVGEPALYYCTTLHLHSVQLIGYEAYSLHCRELIQKSLFDLNVLRLFEEKKWLNWCKRLKLLFPLKNAGKESSLPDAVSLYMWGVHDSDMVLSTALYKTLTKNSPTDLGLAGHKGSQKSDYRALPLTPDIRLQEEEWQYVVKTADPKSKAKAPRKQRYQDIYLFVLANIIRRPIIVIAGCPEETINVSLNSAPEPSGVYLPLLWSPNRSCCFPVVLAFSEQHFTPLVYANVPGPEIEAVPLVIPSGDRLLKFGVPFLFEKNEDAKRQCLDTYLNLINVEGCTEEFITAARLQGNDLPENFSLVQDYFKLVQHMESNSHRNVEGKVKPKLNPNQDQFSKVSALSNFSITGNHCVTLGCQYFSSTSTQPFCHECHKKLHQQATPSSHRKQFVSDRMSFYGNDSPAEVKLPPGPASAPAASSQMTFFNEINLKSSAVTRKCPVTGNKTQHPPPNATLNRVLLRPFTESHTMRELNPEETLVENTMDLLTGRCIMCKNETRTFNGLCYKCLQRRAEASGSDDDQDSIIPGFQSALASSCLEEESCGSCTEPRNGRRCVNDECNFYGTQENLGYCTICYIAIYGNKDHHGQSVSTTAMLGSQPSSSSSVQRNPMKCRALKCTRLGSHQHNGYCEKCFLLTRVDLETSRCSKAEKKKSSTIEPHYKTSIKQDPLCEQFREKVDLETKNVPHGAANQGTMMTENVELTMRLCREKRCKNFGNVKCEGYCNECYRHMLSK